MDSCRLLLAIFLLSGAPAADELAEPALWHAQCAEAVRLLAIQWEILDPQETHFFSAAKDFTADLKVLQARYQQFAAAPPLDECRRFPERMLVEDMLAFNRALQKELKQRLTIDRLHAAELATVLEETEQLFEIWDAVREARCEYRHVTPRREALHQLRSLIGTDAFYAGQLPPHIPVWRIPEY